VTTRSYRNGARNFVRNQDCAIEFTLIEDNSFEKKMGEDRGEEGTSEMIDFLRNLYHRLPRPPSTNYSLFNSQAAFWTQVRPSDRTLVYDIGSKGQAESGLEFIPPGVRLLSIDIDPAAKPDIVADAHDLHMIATDSADGVITSSVLEHVRDPWKVVSEIERILKPGGIVHIGVPFVYRFHADPDDFWRVSYKGIDYCANHSTKSSPAIVAGRLRVWPNSLYTFWVWRSPSTIRPHMACWLTCSRGCCFGSNTPTAGSGSTHKPT
jgi:SAM-dependent methyltransferase